jgi:hypothetical protein
MSGWVKVQDDNQSFIGEYGCGTIIGEEFLYVKNFKMRTMRAQCSGDQRIDETAYVGTSTSEVEEYRPEQAHLLEITLDKFKEIRKYLINVDILRKYFKATRQNKTIEELELLQKTLRKDSQMLETQIKRNY